MLTLHTLTSMSETESMHMCCVDATLLDAHATPSSPVNSLMLMQE